MEPTLGAGAAVATVNASKPGGTSLNTTCTPGLLGVVLPWMSPPNATRRSELSTEFHTSAACRTWLNTEEKLSLGP